MWSDCSIVLVLLYGLFDGAHSDNADRVTVNLSTGQIEGFLHTTEKGNQSYVFFGIPYVEAPLGELRFSPPVPKNSWNDTLDCTGGYKAVCPQNVSISQYQNQSEDCLFINVFAGIACLNQSSNLTIEINDNDTSSASNFPLLTLCPVLYYVHGGVNEFESPAMFPVDDLVDNFASRDVILVTVAYRLGILGFFSTGADDAVGNWGVQDVVEGARWVQNEIGNFGGDKDNVTIMGHSSSASIVSLLSMTNKTVGLFDRAITMSGSGTVYNAIWNDVTDYMDLVRRLNCSTNSTDQNVTPINSSQEILRCMRNVDAQVLVNEFVAVRGLDSDGILPKNLTQIRNDGPNGLFPLPLDKLVQTRRPINVLTGTTKHEDGLDNLSLVRATPFTTASKCVEVVRRVSSIKNKRLIAQACIRQYVTNANRVDMSRPKVNSSFPIWTRRTVAISEDVDYYAPSAKEVTSILEAANNYNTNSKVYLYSFDYEKPRLGGVYPWHAADVSFVMGSHKLNGKFDQRDLQIQSRYLPLFVNFVKYGDPTPEPVDGVTWKALIPNARRPYNYLSVNLPVKAMANYHAEADWFWNTLVPRLDQRNENEWGPPYLNNDADVNRWLSIKGFKQISDQAYSLLLGNDTITLFDNFTQNGTGMFNKSIIHESAYPDLWPLYAVALLCLVMILIVPVTFCLIARDNNQRRQNVEDRRPLLLSQQHFERYDTL